MGTAAVVSGGVVYRAKGDVVEAGDGDVLGNTDPAFVQPAEQPHGHEVVERQHTVAPLDSASSTAS